MSTEFQFICDLHVQVHVADIPTSQGTGRDAMGQCITIIFTELDKQTQSDQLLLL